jgi:hypothetical protein
VAVTNGKKEKADSKMVRMEKERDGERQEGWKGKRNTEEVDRKQT